jgi:hypothetical protein
VFVLEHGLFSIDIINSSMVERSKSQPSIEYKLVQLISISSPSHIKSLDFVVHRIVQIIQGLSINQK